VDIYRLLFVFCVFVRLRISPAHPDVNISADMRRL